MKKEMITEIIFQRDGRRVPIKCEEYLHLLKPEYIINSGYQEAENYSDSEHDGGYYAYVTYEREESDEEATIRVKQRHESLELDMYYKLNSTRIGDFFFYKEFTNKQLTNVRVLRLVGWNKNSKEVRFEMDKVGSNNFLTTTIAQMVGHEWEVNPGDVRRTVISKFGI